MTDDAQTIAADQATYWAYVELFGHQKTAGRISTRKFGTEEMIQVDVPKGEDGLSHTELFNPKAIFSIRPTTEEWCRKFTMHLNKQAHDILPYIPESRPMLADSGAINDAFEIDQEEDETQHIP